NSTRPTWAGSTPRERHRDDPEDEAQPHGIAGLAAASLRRLGRRLVVRRTGSGDRRHRRHADLRDVAVDHGRQLDFVARRERDAGRRLGPGRLEARSVRDLYRRATPEPALRLVTAKRSGPFVADRVAALEVVDAIGVRALFELAVL